VLILKLSGFRWRIIPPVDEKKKAGNNASDPANSALEFAPDPNAPPPRKTLYELYFNAFTFEFQKKVLWAFLVLLITVPWIPFYFMLAVFFWRNVFSWYYVNAAAGVGNGDKDTDKDDVRKEGEEDEPTSVKTKKKEWPRLLPWPVTPAQRTGGILELLTTWKNKKLLFQQLFLVFFDGMVTPFVALIVVTSVVGRLFLRGGKTYSRWEACKDRFVVWGYWKTFWFHG
jgi:hypothetical protein